MVTAPVDPFGGRFVPLEVIQGREHRGKLRIDCDVCIVGSGASGATVGRILAEAGADVVILEEGAHIPADRYAQFRPSESLRYLWRDGGFTVVMGLGDSPMIGLALGRAVGGSSVITGGVCFRVPEEVHHGWVKELGLQNMSYRAFEKAYDEVERNMNVQTVADELRSRGVLKFAAGADRLGIPMKPLRRNMVGCQGSSRCNLGCPHLSKLSVDLSYLPQATRAGARLYSDCLVHKLRVQGDRVAGVEGKLLDKDGRRSGRFQVNARLVVMAAGTIHTPVVLRRSRVGRQSRSLGRHFTLHPGYRMMALFSDPIENWKGALQSTYTDRFADEGILLVSAFAPPSIVVNALPGVGQEFQEHLAKFPYMACFGGMVHDDGDGRIWPTLGREPIITYRMSDRDRWRFRRGIQLLGEVFFEAGAKQVYLPILGSRPVRSMEDLRVIDDVSMQRIECMAFHPLGSARMAQRGEDGVVDEWGEAFELRNLFVADGSVFPTSIGVNSQIAIMSMATRIAWRLAEQPGRWRGHSPTL